ncbi:MAG: RNA polymerase sigma factor RpoD/SigA [Treponema sp.]|nr:RNA polymerase sigma factor RpoD/SigA [Treponema sp.]
MTVTKGKKTKTMRSDAGDNLLGMYFSDINRIPLLNREDEDKFAKAAAEGNITARNKLINSNLRFVVSIAKKYQGMGIPLADLINEGNVGLIYAAEKFDVNRGYHFISYAVWWIRQSILKALYEKSRFIRLPVNQTSDLIHITKAKKLLADNAGVENQVQEIAQMLNKKEHYIEDIMAISQEVVSLEKMVTNDAGTLPLGNSVIDDRYEAPEQEVMKKSLEDDINELLGTLSYKEAEIIRLHFGLGTQMPLSLQEIGERFNLTKERVRQIEKKALSRLKHISRRVKLAPYVA